MATKKETGRLMRQAFAEVDSEKNDLATRVSQINQERNDFVNTETLNVVTDGYLRTRYREYATHISGGGTLDDFVRTKLSLEQKLEIISDYNINRQILEGNNGVEVKLGDIANRKKDNKEEFKKDALDILNMYQDVLDENQQRIAEAEAAIEKSKQLIESLKSQKKEITGKDEKSIAYAGRVSGEIDKEKALANIDAQILDEERKISEKNKELEGLRQLQIHWKTELKARETEISKFLKAENIYAFDRTKKEAETESQKDEKKEEKQNNGENGLVPTKPKDVAKSMFQDFITSSPERQRKLLRQAGNEDILKMSRRLGPLDRKRLKVQLEERMDELASDSVTFTANDGSSVTLTKDEMKSMKDMDDTKIKAMREELDRFNNDFSQKTIDEIDEFENRLDYIRIAALLHSTSRGVFGRFFDGFNKKANRIYELAKSTARYATLKGERTTRKEEMLDRLRAKVSRAPMDEYTKSSERPLDKTGADEFSR